MHSIQDQKAFIEFEEREVQEDDLENYTNLQRNV